MTAAATIKATGEVVEATAETPEQLIEALRLVNDTIAAYTELKKALQDYAPEVVNTNGTYEHDGYMLRVSYTQRMNYDKAVLREVFDPDLLETFLEPSKGRIDTYIKQHLNELGEASTRLRHSMVETGKPYRAIRLERLA